MNTKETKVISFRVPKEVAVKVDKCAKKAKKRRAHFVESLFISALEQLLETGKEAETALAE